MHKFYHMQEQVRLLREQLEELLANPSTDKYRAQWARKLLEINSSGQQPANSATFTIQTLTCGNFALIALSGEMCVGYSLRFKAELKDRPIIVAGYCNGIIAYVPTARILSEGGYEADGSYFYFGLPAPFKPEVEETVVRKALGMASPSSDCQQPL
ncbi:MAG: hypothetical protein AUJ92_04725 [Armatimonadetes bacterium CG2_30_59_28]|nr:hypothetical protein [Armatimonadota bacterium]OIO96936.1 MAG: hypothetical protein AUJ92_04725 [Armatimonadetes bacterium CG2_30_59_28]PIU65018.1 MAG: hypothetical protein COS85_10355 [Armatimonadetes bacterium CG07_land_8_20_14_0_80_59_28]PIX38566.1 MAG: hypothetical protein COZ56_20140 [Armatimonadetes bacterium CG_4_8_14_3_um_filter_58_9]PIY40354.1 MAG: hypothetical protein COZ05_17625 [Armatimonadetes bacterium CG_4_10_14_3_um_filter_59_10]PJB78287.1 MAG: hypothetical protein CO095_006